MCLRRIAYQAEIKPGSEWQQREGQKSCLFFSPHLLFPSNRFLHRSVGRVSAWKHTIRRFCPPAEYQPHEVSEINVHRTTDNTFNRRAEDRTGILWLVWFPFVWNCKSQDIQTIKFIESHPEVWGSFGNRLWTLFISVLELLCVCVLELAFLSMWEIEGSKGQGDCDITRMKCA